MRAYTLFLIGSYARQWARINEGGKLPLVGNGWRWALIEVQGVSVRPRIDFLGSVRSATTTGTPAGGEKRHNILLAKTIYFLPTLARVDPAASILPIGASSSTRRPTVIMDHRSQLAEASSADTSRNHYVYNALSIAQKVVRQRHAALRTSFPAEASLSGLLDQCSNALSSDTTPIAVPARPVFSERQRQALRSLASDTAKQEEARNAEKGRLASRAILTHGLLQSARQPRPLEAEQRERFKENFSDALDVSQPPRHPHLRIDPFLESGLPVVDCHLTLAAVDHEEPMPEEWLHGQHALWDTGAEMTFITDDILSPEFRAFVNENETHNPYRVAGTTRVQLSCVVEFSNSSLIEIHTIAVVVPHASAPNGRSGVILGQRGVMDSLQYESVPSRIAKKRDPDFPADCWGSFNISSYCNMDDEMECYD